MLHPKAFNINRLEANEMLQYNGNSIAKIPKISDRIRQDDTGKISLVVSRETDKATGEIREKTVEMGDSISNVLPGMMLVSDVYHDYFDSFGNLINDPMKQNEPVGSRPQVTHGQNESDGSRPQVTHQEEEESMSQRQSHFPGVSMEDERAAVLVKILDSISRSIANQAKKHPDALINIYKARKINDILIEIRVRYQGSGYEDLLELIEAPHEVEEDGKKYIDGMTYSDAEVLLSHYVVILQHIRLNNKK